MNRQSAIRILPVLSLMAFEIAALVAAAQALIFVRSGAWVSISLGDVLERIGFGAPPASWMDGSVYDMIWNEPLWLTCMVIGLLAATYAGIDRYESEEAKPAYVYP